MMGQGQDSTIVGSTAVNLTQQFFFESKQLCEAYLCAGKIWGYLYPSGINIFTSALPRDALARFTSNVRVWLHDQPNIPPNTQKDLMKVKF